MDIINIQNAGFSYPSHVPELPSVKAVSDISLCIEQGSYWVVLGRNGSGKSTLSRLMNALLIPFEGVVIIDGLETSDEEHLWQVRRTVGVVFQNPDNQIVATTVEEDVAFGPENLGVPQPEIRQRVDESLKIVDMEEYVKHSPHMLSGGQKQRVAVAGVLAMKPKCIVLDEATSMLDPQGRKEVLLAIRTLHDHYGLTVILITHHMDEAIEADQVLVMLEGKKLFSGSPAEVFQETDLLREAGLDVPQLTAFGYSLVSEHLYQGALPVQYDEALRMMDKFESQLQLYGTLQQDFQMKQRMIVNKDHPIIKINNLRHVYMPGTHYERVALDGVSLDIFKGEILGIIGHTGSGKSTFVQHLNGLLKATSGTLEVEGTLVQPKTLKALRRKVGLIFQYPEHQLFEETVYKDIAFGLAQNGTSVAEIDDKVHKVAELLSITDDMLQKSPFELSGGQKRRVAIAGVLAMEPSILVLDEPTAGLDPKGSMKVLQLLKELNRKEGTTILFISHHMEYIASLSDRIAVFRDGRLAMLDEPHVIFSNADELEKMNLDVPAITRLFLDVEKKIKNKMPIILSVDEATAFLVSQLKVVQNDR